MKPLNAEKYHKLYGNKKSRIKFQGADFLDYYLMITICFVLIYLVYGMNNVFTWLGCCCCLFMLITFPIRHGCKLTVPVIMREPQSIIYLIIYKTCNIRYPLLLALFFLLLENYIIYLTPQLPHAVTFMHYLAIILFYLHFALITLYRTIILISHLYNRKIIFNALSETVWKNFLPDEKNTVLEIGHAYVNGILTHIITMAPWYLIINLFHYSAILIPLALITNFYIESHFMKIVNYWFYRDHWVSHHSEFEFIYLHGSHHDSIPSALIGVAENGFLEGFFRQFLGFAHAYYNPIAYFITTTALVYSNMKAHQYIPGVYPEVALGKNTSIQSQHSIHHYWKLEPYGLGGYYNDDIPKQKEKVGFFTIPDDLINSIKIDEQLNGFERNNEAYKKFLELVENFQSNK